MIDPELKKQLETINESVIGKMGKRAGFWRWFLSGTAWGLGSVVGLAIALTVIGWILNTIGVIPAFRNTARQWQQTLEQFQKNK